MARVNDLIRQAKSTDPQLGAELEREFRALSARRAFGLNFERHRPEAVELANRPVRRGDKVRIQPERGKATAGDQRLWVVQRIQRVEGERVAHLIESNAETPESRMEFADDLLVIAEFRDPIYPGLTPTGSVTNTAEDVPAHTVINGENYHVLKALTYTHRGKIDAIYIDPPYNTGARDWKYNNDYVDSEDMYRHSKWLAFMERRLLLAKQLLNPDDSVLIVTIDEKEYLRIGLLLEQTFPEARIQMVTTAINATGAIRSNEFTRVNEFIYFILHGSAQITPEPSEERNQKVPWNLLQRREMPSRRGGPQPGPDQFYPIYIDTTSGHLREIGQPIALGTPRETAPELPGCKAIFPIKPDGTEMNWGLTPNSLRTLADKGYVRVSRNRRAGSQGYSISYLTSGKVKAIETGEAQITGTRLDGSVIATYKMGQASMPTSMWFREAHNAQSHGTKLLTRLLPTRKFPFPKSLYAVEDALRFFVKEKPDAVVLDFFAGSGTTAHAVMRLNRQDGGQRQCLSVTNNEVAAEEHTKLRKQRLRPGDEDWEALGICEYVTKPRIEAAITGKTPGGESIKGDYRFTDEFPMAEGFEANAEFFTLTYEAPIPVSHNRAFSRIAPLLWLRAGAQGSRIDTIPDVGWAATDHYGVLFDLDQAGAFAHVIEAAQQARVAYVVTDDERRFQAVAQRLPDHVEPVRLYESYLSNFRFVNGE